jgi:hypothetical protein
MGAAREKDQADFDLDRFVDLFDEAMTSKDPRVVETLRNLLMIVALTRPETGTVSIDRNQGPLRRLFEDMHNLNRSVGRLQEEINDLRFRESTKNRNPWDTQDKYTMAGAAKMAQQIDQDILDQMRRQQHQVAMRINGGSTLGPETAAKGLK